MQIFVDYNEQQYVAIIDGTHPAAYISQIMPENELKNILIDIIKTAPISTEEEAEEANAGGSWAQLWFVSQAKEKGLL